MLEFCSLEPSLVFICSYVWSCLEEIWSLAWRKIVEPSKARAKRNSRALCRCVLLWKGLALKTRGTKQMIDKDVFSVNPSLQIKFLVQLRFARLLCQYGPLPHKCNQVNSVSILGVLRTWNGNALVGRSTLQLPCNAEVGWIFLGTWCQNVSFVLWMLALERRRFGVQEAAKAIWRQSFVEDMGVLDWKEWRLKAHLEGNVEVALNNFTPKWDVSCQ